MRIADRLAAAALLVFAVLAPQWAAAQCVSLTTLGSAYTQNFDTLSNTAGSTTNNLTIPGWFMTESGGGARDNEQYAVDTGASTTGDTYSYGAAGSTERALGSLRAGTLIPLFGACFTNNTGSTITNLAIAYNGEEWRLGTAGRTDQLNFEYSLNSTDLVTGTWTNVAALNFITPDTATVGAKNGNAAADRAALSSTITGLSIPNGATFWIRWNDVDATGADDGLAIDDFSLTPSNVPPVNLSINDVSLNEGNAGTTSFTFTVSLSAPAPAGGVTFDIATADGTATQPSDYTQKSLTSQTIPAGSSTYSFTVLVNGDTTPETNETFFVNVTNVTGVGVTVTDGQGQGTIVNDDAAPNLTINDVSLNEGNAGTTTFTFTVSLSAPAPAGGVTFDIATADGSALAPSDYTAKSLTSQTIPAGSSTYTFDVLVNGDATPESDETFFVNVTNITNAIGTDTQGQGTIVNDDLAKIHDVQGNGAASPLVGQTVSVEGIVIANFQGASKLKGFFLQEEDADADADPATSEGIFVFCNSCPTAVAEGQKVKATGVVSEVNNLTQISATTAPSVVVTNAGNNLALVTPTPIALPVAGDVDAFYERFEGMLVTFVDTLTVTEHAELGRLGQLTLSQGGRPSAFTEASAPNVAGYTAYLDSLSRRQVVLDDDNNTPWWYLTTSSPPGPADGFQYVFHPQANGGFGVGTQGVDFFRAGDLVNGLTGVVDWADPGSGTASWRIRPAAAHPVTFTVANPRPVTPPAVAGSIKVASIDLQNYFTTIDTTASNSSGPCGPSGTLDCRGADSVAELNRQRDRASIVTCTMNADVVGYTSLENTTPSDSINDLLGAINTRCGGAHPYAFVNTGGTLGTDAIRVQMVYRTGVVSPVGSPLVDLDPTHDRPPTAQTFDVVDATNAAFGRRFTVVVNHATTRDCTGASGADADQGDGQGCYDSRRTQQSSRLLTWINGTVLPAAGDPDVLIIGSLNAYGKEDPVATLATGGYANLVASSDPATYSSITSGQLGQLDYAFASASLVAQVGSAGAWHINADEASLFDYNDEVKDAGEAAGEEKPDGSALTPPRVVFQPGTPYRASDREPLLVGLFATADMTASVTDTPDPVTAGNDISYAITVSNIGASQAVNPKWQDALPAGTTFVSLPAVAGWSCTTPAVGSNGTVSCTAASLAAGSSASFSLAVKVAASFSGATVTNTIVTSSDTPDSDTGNDQPSAATAVQRSADLSITVTDSPDPVSAGNNVTYTITASNAGPSDAASVSVSDTLPAGTTFVSIASPGGWTCIGPGVGNTGTVICSAPALAPGSAVFTLVVKTSASLAAGSISNTATISSSTNDPNPGQESATATTTVNTSADLSISKTATASQSAGNNVTYTLTATNAGPSDAASVVVSDTLPAGTTFVSLASPGGWSCTMPAVGSAGTVSCSSATLAVGNAVFTLIVKTASSMAAGALSNTATIASSTTDPNPGQESATASTTISAAADLSVTKLATTPTAVAGSDYAYSITVTNAGPSDAASVVLSDSLPVPLAFRSLTSPPGWTCTTPAVDATGPISCSRATFAPGSPAVFTLVTRIDAATAAAVVVSNTATIASATTDPNPGQESSTATAGVTASADVSTTMTATPSPVTVGSNITYTITVANAGPSNAASVALSDTLPAGTTFVSLASPAGWTCTTPAVGSGGVVSCTRGSLAPGSAVFTLVAKTDPAATVPGNVVNTATATSTTTDPNPGNESAQATTPLAGSADLSVTVTDSPDPVTPGTNVTYTITMTNAGPGTASNAHLADTLPASTTFVSLASPAGWTCTAPAVGAAGAIACDRPSMAVGNAVFTLVAKVAPNATGTITNTATASSATSDPNAANDGGSAVTTVGEAVADLSVTKSSATPTANAGSNVTYTIVLTSAGPSDAPQPTLTDVLPAATTFVSIASPAGWTCTTPAVDSNGTVSCTATSMPAGTAQFTLVAKIAATAAEGTTVTNTATASFATGQTVAAPAAAKLSATKPRATAAAVPAGRSATDPNPGNNSGSAAVVVVTSADMSITITDAPDPVIAGGNLTYTMTVTNAGPTNATPATWTDTLPASTTFVSLAAANGWTCTTPAVGAGGSVSCTHASFAPGSASFTLVVKVAAATAGGAVLSNTANVTTGSVDPQPANNSATATTTVQSPAVLSGTKEVSGSFRPGETVTYTIVIANTSPSPQGDNPGDEMVDVLPAEVTLQSASATSGTVVANVATNTVRWNGAVPGNGSVTVTIVATLKPTVANGQLVSNQATISYDSDGNGTNDTTVPTRSALNNGAAVFLVAAPPAQIPALGLAGLLGLMLAMLGIGAALAARRISSART